MTIKFDSPECAWIYCAMALYLAAFLTMLARWARAGWTLYVLGFAATTTAFGIHWHRVGHVPLQNLFEVFLCLGMLICPLSILCLRLLRVGGVAGDCLIAAALLLPAGFVERFSPAPRMLPPALQSGLFAPHVAAYMAAYVMLAKAGVQAIGQLAGRAPRDGRLVPYELGTYRMVRLAFPLLTAGLILGAVWGKIAWGDWWNWDPKELWSLASWLVFLWYLHFRRAFGRRYPNANAAAVLTGLAAIVVTLLWVNLAATFQGLHSYAT